MLNIKILGDESGFSWKIFFKKLGLNLAITLVTGAIVIWQEDPAYIVLVPALQAILNYLKNR